MYSDIENLDKINIDNLINYIYSLNWHKVADIKGYGMQYASSDEEYSAIVLTNRKVVDYNEVLLNTLKTLSEYSKINIETLVLSLLNNTFDSTNPK